MSAIRQLDRVVAKLIAPLRRRVQLMVGRAVLSAINDSKQVQTVKAALLSDEVSEDVERFQEYGFTSVPYDDIEAVVVCVGGNRGHGIVVATDDRARRPTGLDEGDVALYDSNGVRVLCDDDAKEVLLGDAPTEFVALANLVNSELSSFKSDLDSLKTALAAHVHPGVTVGGASTAVSPGFASWTPHTPSDVDADEVKAK